MSTSTNKSSKFPSLTLLIIIAIGIAYVHGWRIANLAETPSSMRPWNVVLAGKYE